MSYTEEEIKKYLDILHNYKVDREVVPTLSKCCNCPNNKFFTIDSGYKVCNECGTTNGHVLGFYDVKDYDRLHYRKKSVYHRKYHYEKKVNQISKIINLNDDEKCELYDRLIKIDKHIMEILNKQYFRKRMININLFEYFFESYRPPDGISEEDYMKELNEEYLKLKREEARRLLGLNKK